MFLEESKDFKFERQYCRLKTKRPISIFAFQLAEVYCTVFEGVSTVSNIFYIMQRTEAIRQTV